MKNKFILLLLLLNLFFCIDYSNNIYSISSSSRNAALGSLKISSGNISSVFDAPLEKNENNFYFSYSSEFNGYIDLFHLGYGFNFNPNIIIGFGLVYRGINEGFYTSDAWNDDGNGYIEIEEIDYSQINSFSDNELGLLISFNKIFNKNSILCYKIKPNYHTIGSYNAFGLSFDVSYYKRLNNNSFLIGINDVFSQKKWNYSHTEKFERRFFLNYMYKFKKVLFSFEFDNLSNYKAGIEYKVIELLSFRLGNSNSNLSFGFGFNSEFIDVDYAFILNNELFIDESHKIDFIFKFKNNS